MGLNEVQSLLALGSVDTHWFQGFEIVAIGQTSDQPDKWKNAAGLEQVVDIGFARSGDGIHFDEAGFEKVSAFGLAFSSDDDLTSVKGLVGVGGEVGEKLRVYVRHTAYYILTCLAALSVFQGVWLASFDVA